ncbi:MAG: hypothetical protein ACP5JL_06510 [bacterium]
MMNIRYLKLIGNISLVIGILNFILSFIGRITAGEVIFVELVLLSLLSQGLHNRIFRSLVFLMMIIPVIFFNSLADRLLISIAYLYTLYINFRGLTKITYGGSIDGFKSALRIMVIIISISILLSIISPFKLILFNRLVFPYFMVYLVTSIILLRTLRYLEYNPANREMDRINLRYSAAIISISFLLSLEPVRGVLFKGISYVFRLSVEIISIVFTGILWVFGYIFELLFGIIGRKNTFKLKIYGLENKELLSGNLKIGSRMGLMKQVEKNTSSSGVIDRVLLAMAGTIILAIVLYIIVRLFQKYTYNRKEKKEDYVEVKEFILREAKGTNLLERFLSVVRPKNSLEKIRLYYRRYLQACKGKGIELRDSDTTLEIYKKSEGFFNKNIIKEMRDIYIGIRYSDIKPDSTLVREFIKLYKKMDSKRDKK